MNEFDKLLAVKAASLRTENAPKGLPTCPNCALRKLNQNAGAPGSDYWDCTAISLLPVFVTHERYRHPINLKHFDPASTYAERLNATKCPLFQPA